MLLGGSRLNARMDAWLTEIVFGEDALAVLVAGLET